MKWKDSSLACVDLASSVQGWVGRLMTLLDGDHPPTRHPHLGGGEM